MEDHLKMKNHCLGLKQYMKSFEKKIKTKLQYEIV